MNKMKLMNFFFAMALLTIFNFHLYSQEVSSTAVVTFLSGEVKNFRNGAMSPIKKNDILLPGDEISVGNKSSVDIQLSSGSAIKLKSNSKIKINSLLESESKETTRLSLFSGTIFAKVFKKTGKESQFLIAGPTLTAGVRGTEFVLSTGETDDANSFQEGVYVKEGEVAVTEERGSKEFSVSGGEELVRTAKGMQKQILQDASKEKLRILETIIVMKEESFQMLRESRMKNKEMLESLKNQPK